MLSRLKTRDYIYIDLEDIKLVSLDFLKFLDDFIDTNSIKTVVIDSYEPQVPVPQARNIVLISNIYLEIKDFETINLPALKFREFLLFDKHQSITTSFDFFLKHGNLPHTAKTTTIYKKTQLKQHLQSICENPKQYAMIKQIFKYGSQAVSKSQIYQNMKKHENISKDKFFEFIKILEKKNMISFVPKYGHKNSVKKLYIYDFVYVSGLNSINKFNNMFENMIYLEFASKYPIYYSDHISFYIPQQKTIYLCVPFFSMFDISHGAFDFLQTNIVKYIKIITINKEEQFFIDDVSCEVLPFYKWAVS